MLKVAAYVQFNVRRLVLLVSPQVSYRKDQYLVMKGKTFASLCTPPIFNRHVELLLFPSSLFFLSLQRSLDVCSSACSQMYIF